MIKAVLIDIDDTLLDFSESAKKAIEVSFGICGLEYNEHVASTFHEINDGLWKKIERKELTKQEMYGLRWNTILKALGIEYDGSKMEPLFRSTLSSIAQPVKNAYELLEYLYKKYPLYAATNSSYDHQKNRLVQADMLKYFKNLFVSEAMGALKPAKEYFDKCFMQMGDCTPSEVVLIGDSLTADITGGINYGLKTIWFNPKKEECPKNVRPDHIVSSLLEIKNII